MEGPGVLFVSMPFASPASFKHAEKVVQCLSPICRCLFIVGDGRIDLSGLPAHVVRYCNLPSLHYVVSRRPWLWSAMLWIFKLVWILLRASWAVFETRRQVDVVISFLGVYSTPILLLARLFGKKTVIFWVNSDANLARIAYKGRPGGRLVVYVLEMVERINRSLVDVCAVESLRLTQALRLETCRHKVQPSHSYIDTDFYTVSTPIEDRPRVVGFLGRLSPGKGITPLLAAAAALRESGIVFCFIGDGPLRGEVETALRRPELSHVEFIGWANADVIVQSLNGFRLLVLPSESEGLPGSVLEAMACGTPVLATAVGAIPDVILHNVTGFILPDREPATIARSIQEALNHPDLVAIAKRGQQLVFQNFSLSAVSREWRDILDGLAPIMSATKGVSG